MRKNLFLPSYKLDDKIKDGFILLEGRHRCPDCNAYMDYWSMQDYEYEDCRRIRRWWHTNGKGTKPCNRMWDYAD